MMKRPSRQSKKPTEGREGLLERMRAANPAGAALLDKHQAKADLAMALRSVRKAKGMTPADLRRASEDLGRPLTLSVISELESPTAALPSLESSVRYSAVCGAQVELSFSFGPDDDLCSSRVTLS